MRASWNQRMACLVLDVVGHRPGRENINRSGGLEAEEALVLVVPISLVHGETILDNAGLTAVVDVRRTRGNISVVRWACVGGEEASATGRIPAGLQVVHRHGGDYCFGRAYWRNGADACEQAEHLSLIHISEPTRLGMISYAVF